MKTNLNGGLLIAGVLIIAAVFVVALVFLWSKEGPKETPNTPTTAQTEQLPANETPSIQLPANEIPSIQLPANEIPSIQLPANEIPSISQSDMDRGWYYGDTDQKKPGTPSTWLLRNAGTRSAQWYDPSK